MYNSRFFTIAFMIFIAALSRLIPHPPNFSPIFAVSLFAGATILSRKESIFIPLVAMLISDYFIGFHALMPVVYVLTILMVCAGWSVQRKFSAFRIAGFTVLGSVVFFLVTNFAVWISSGMYSLNLAGILQCYSAAIPFFQNT
ncbi:MAG: hypothetical protein K8R21_11415, partial [Leptospira sp.]|nr:hypothetical protein [Leptospira sp.]